MSFLSTRRTPITPACAAVHWHEDISHFNSAAHPNALFCCAALDSWRCHHDLARKRAQNHVLACVGISVRCLCRCLLRPRQLYLKAPKPRPFEVLQASLPHRLRVCAGIRCHELSTPCASSKNSLSSFRLLPGMRPSCKARPAVSSKGWPWALCGAPQAFLGPRPGDQGCLVLVAFLARISESGCACKSCEPLSRYVKAPATSHSPTKARLAWLLWLPVPVPAHVSDPGHSPCGNNIAGSRQQPPHHLSSSMLAPSQTCVASDKHYCCCYCC